MTSILIVEDDRFKCELIETELNDALGRVKVHRAKSVHEGVKEINLRQYDLVLLDIALPSHRTSPGGGQPISQPSGGIEILLELQYCGREDPVVIITQYPEIEYDGELLELDDAMKKLASSLNVLIRDVIYFNADDEDWKSQLRKAVSPHG